MREIIFVGTDEQTKAWLDEARDRIRTILQDLHLSYRVMTASDPFFIGVFRTQAQVQQTLEMKFEIHAHLPYKQDTIAVGSYNHHGNFFGRSLNIRLAKGPACTGCFGMGFERLAFAFVAQHGLDTGRWPAAVREALSSNVESVERLQTLPVSGWLDKRGVQFGRTHCNSSVVELFCAIQFLWSNSNEISSSRRMRRPVALLEFRAVL